MQGFKLDRYRRYTKGVLFLSKMVYKRRKDCIGLKGGASPRITLCWVHTSQESKWNLSGSRTSRADDRFVNRKVHKTFVLRWTLACVQTSPFPQEKSIFPVGVGTSVHRLVNTGSKKDTKRIFYFNTLLSRSRKVTLKPTAGNASAVRRLLASPCLLLVSLRKVCLHTPPGGTLFSFKSHWMVLTLCTYCARQVLSCFQLGFTVYVLYYVVRSDCVSIFPFQAMDFRQWNFHLNCNKIKLFLN